MKYTPKEDLEGINSNPDHPLKEFSILIVGALVIIGVAFYLSGAILGEVAVRFSPKIEKMFTNINLNAISPQTKNKKNPEELENLLASLLPIDFKKNPPKILIYCDSQTNAFALPNNQIWVTSQLLEEVKTERGLAFVIAHELGHILNKDHIRAFGQSMGQTMLMSLIGLGDLNQGLYKIPSQLSYFGLSRNAESLADDFALERMKYKYSSYQGADELFRVLIEKNSLTNKLPSFLSTHPHSEKRSAHIRALSQNESFQTELALHSINHTCPLN